MSYEEKLQRYVVYEALDDDEINKEYDYIIRSWKQFVMLNDPTLVENEDYYLHERNMSEALRRVDKRRVYYKVFHDLDRINEFKYVALLCYWINTLKPFMVIKDNSPIYNAPNELFCVHLIISVIRSIYMEKYPDKPFSYPSEKRIADMVYNFKYCDLSREATIAFVETFADNYGVGIQYILEHQS